MRWLGSFALAAISLFAASIAASGAGAQEHHAVRQGQSLSQIARRHGVRVRDLASANRMQPSDPLRVGQVLIVPARGVVFVGPGQTLSHIAREHGVGIEALARANRMRITSTLRVGQRLVLPGFHETRAPAAEPEDWGEPAAVGLVRLRTRTETGAFQLRDDRGRVPRLGLVELGRLMHRGDASLPAARDRGEHEEPHDYPETWRFAPGLADPFDDGETDEDDETEVELTSVIAADEPAAELPSARLALLLAAISDHFGGREIQIISGFRQVGRRTRETSRHVRGEAVDVRIDGVSKRALWDYCLSLPATGCGLYPMSTFVHVDVRDSEAQWVDWSGPGRRARYGTLRGPSRRRGHARPRVGRHVTRPEVLPLEVIVADPETDTVTSGRERSPIPTS